MLRSSQNKFDGTLSLSTRESGEVYIPRMEIQTTTFVSKFSGGEELGNMYQTWEDYTKDWNKQRKERVPGTIPEFFQSSPTWPRAIVELAFVEGTFLSLALSLATACFAILVFSGNIILAFMASVLLVGTIVSMFGFLVLRGWSLGAVEAIALSIVVGLSVDYSLHLGHSYNHAKSRLRGRRTQQALEEVGISTLGASLTTIGSMCVLLFCTIQVFIVMGTIISVTLGLAILHSLGTFAALLRAIGPEGECGNVRDMCCYQTKSKRRQKREDHKSRKKHQSPPFRAKDRGASLDDTFEEEQEMLPEPFDFREYQRTHPRQSISSKST